MSTATFPASPAAPLLNGWPAVHAAGLEAVGGKALTLARLDQLGFAVPAGAVVPAEAYHAWLEDIGLRPALLAAAALPDGEQAAALDDLAHTLAARPAGPRLAQALGSLLASEAWQGPLAVRSSSAQEDGAKASFAGIHASFLNVQGQAAVLQAIAGVWCSLWTPAAVAYRQRMGLAHEDAAMAVLLMPLVAAQASGIGFTCDPLSGRDDHLRIHANWYLGESLVGGQAEGDDIVLGETVGDELVLLSYTVGSKAVASVPQPQGGTQARATDPSHAAAAVLTPAQALVLGEQLRLAALALDLTRPAFDCEWAWDGERFWLLQARPVTTLARCTYAALRDQPVVWSRGNTRDALPEPISPVDWWSLRKMVNLLLEAAYRLSGFPLLPGAQRAALFHGCLYLNTTLIQWEGHAGFGLPPESMNKLMGGHHPALRVSPTTVRQRLQRALGLARFMARAGAMRRRGEQAVGAAMAAAHEALARHTAAPPPDDAAMARAMRHHRDFIRTQTPLHFLQGAGGGSLSMLVDLAESARPGEGHALASALLAGGPPSVTAQQGYALTDLARLAMADPQARAWLARRAAGDRDTALPPGHPVRAALDAFLARYGHRGIYETYVRNPRWREQPDYLIDSLPGLADTDLVALRLRQQAVSADALRQVGRALPWWRRGWLRVLVRQAKRETNGREAGRSALMACAEPIRLLLLQQGRRWTERHWLSAAEDIFLLAWPEILAVLEGRRGGPDLPALVAQRRALFTDWMRQAADVPDVVTEGGTEAPCRLTAAPAEAAGPVLHGVAVGSGRATGTVRLLRSPDEGSRLQRGDILVVPSTDPAWTPLFLKAGGLVMETGGFLSHGAIVAREFGIPAVVNLPGVMTRLREGERVEVDSQRGTVTRLDGEG